MRQRGKGKWLVAEMGPGGDWGGLCFFFFFFLIDF